MTAPDKPAQSRWGTFISSAITGVESRLDNMLTESEEAERQQAAAKPVSATKPAPQPAMQAPKAAPAPNKPASRVNDRLQARLAKAVAARSAGASPRSSVDQPRPSPTPSARASMDKGPSSGTVTPPAKDEPENKSKPATPDLSIAVAPDASNNAKSDDAVSTQPPPAQSMPELVLSSTPEPAVSEYAAKETTIKPKTESQEQVPEKLKSTENIEIEDLQKQKNVVTTTKQDNQEEESKKQEAPTPVSAPALSIEPQVEAPQTNEELEVTKSRQQEEIQEYIERIDTLQAKIQYLSKNAADAAKKSKAAAPSGSAERKLAEKDEKIALLMEEGRKLSTSEQKFRTAIRKLRAQVTDNEKQLEELKKEKEKAAAEAETIRNRMNSDEEQEKRNEEIRKASAVLQREIDALKRENALKDAAYKRLEQDSKATAEHAELASIEARNKAVAVERAKQKELEESLSSLQTENEMISHQAHLDGLDWQEKLDRAAERSRNLEEELKMELLASESKLEAMRVTAEEASSGIGGESQIKLIRQIETLQSQYASASNNWQGIEASLLTKVSNLEKERDEAQRRESEMRKKARDSATRCRRLEDELQDVAPALSAAQQELETCREQLAALRVQVQSNETALEQARADLEKQQRAVPKEFAVEVERRQWVDDVGSLFRGQSRPESPLLSVPRTFSSDLIGLPVPGRPPRRSPTPGSIPDTPNEGMFFGRRLSNQPPLRTSTLSTLGTGIPPPPLSPFETTESPRATSPPPDRDDDLDSSAPRNVAQDMISVSTVGAGPTVQLVERMSAAIRRLEAEKVAAKEEMVRVCGQRDEARTDIVGLMKDLEDAKSATTRVADLEAEVGNLNSRYQTTLEMLGEKSELVEELKADVQDVKAMYRELVERTVK